MSPLVRVLLWIRIAIAWCGNGLPAPVEAAEHTATNSNEVRALAPRLQPGDRLLLAPGEYRGGILLEGIAGTPDKPILLAAADPSRPPIFVGGNSALHLKRCHHLVLDGLHVRGARLNGINADDGGAGGSPSRGLVFQRLRIEETGPRGNFDALKLSGLDDFHIRRCHFEAWGGSAIDLVGCHRGRISACTFRGREGFSQANGVQLKGGSSEILVELCTFEQAGQRAINLGGSTGEAYFRPRREDFEAKDITVAGNRFVGSLSAVAWVNAIGGHVHHNTIYLPEKWVLRILQENTSPGMKPCSGGRFEHNLVVHDGRVRVFVNVGSNTAPETFRFFGNAWFQTDGTSRPRLPTEEAAGLYRVDPEMHDPGTASMRIGSRDPRLQGIGADAYQPAEGP